MGKGNCEKRGQPGKKGEIQKIEQKRNIKGEIKKEGEVEVPIRVGVQ
jgi:hypothetical protein